MNFKDRILEAAARPQGVGSADFLPQHSRQDVNTACFKMVRAGLLFVAKIGRGRTRWFASAAARDVFVAQHNRQATVHHRRVAHAHAGNAPWPADAPAHRPAHVVVQICPPYRPRFEEFTLPWVHGGLRAA